MKNPWDDPIYRAKVTAAIKHRANLPEVKAKFSSEHKARWQDPEYRQKMLTTIRSPKRLKKWKKHMTDAKREELGTTLEARWADTEFRESTQRKLKERCTCPEQKQKMLEVLRSTGKKILNLPKFLPEHPNALHVKLRDPNNRVWEVHNVAKFVEEHQDLFAPHTLEFNKLGNRKAAQSLRRLTAKSSRRNSAMGWTLVSDTEVFYNGGEDILERQQHEIHSI
jgi:hypothetical protein